MICPNYATFRQVFAAGGASNAHDGFKEWPGTTLLRANGFSGTLAIVVNNVTTPFDATTLAFPSSLTFPDFPIDLTCAAFALDSVYGVDEYDWYVSQRKDPANEDAAEGGQYLTVSRSDAIAINVSRSSAIVIDVDPTAVAELLPDHVGATYDSSELPLLLRHVHVYARRRSDGAIQWAKLYAT